MTCSACGADTPPERPFCRHCGTARASRTRSDARPGARATCPTCGRPVSPAARFCRYDGTPVVPTSQNAGTVTSAAREGSSSRAPDSSARHQRAARSHAERPAAGGLRRSILVGVAILSLTSTVALGVWLSRERSTPPTEATSSTAPEPGDSVPSSPAPAPADASDDEAAPEPDDEDPTAELLAELREADPRVRASAARELGRHRPTSTEIVAALAGAMGHPDPAVQEAAVLALADTRHRSAVSALIEVVEGSGRRGRAPIAAAATAALAQMGRERARSAVPALARALGDAQPSVRSSAARGLGALADAAVAPELMKLASADPAPDVRAAAVEALEVLDPQAAAEVPALAWIEAGELALREGRLVTPPGENALEAARQAELAAPESRRTARFHEQVGAAIAARVDRLLREGDLDAAAVLVDQAATLDLDCPGLAAATARVEAASREEYERTHRFRLAHRHGLSLGIRRGGKLSLGKGMCIGMLELLPDGFRFATQETADGRRDDVMRTFAQIESIELKDDGQELKVKTTDGNWSFVGDPDSLRAIAAHLEPAQESSGP